MLVVKKKYYQFIISFFLRRNPVHTSPHPDVYDNHIWYLRYTAVEELFYKCPKSVSPAVNSSFQVIFKSAWQA